MALSDPQRTVTSVSTLSHSQIKDESLSVIIPSKRDIFLSTYRRQNFTLPNSIMHYIAKNPKNSKFYQKMVKSCKYFFIKNPILVVSYLRYNQDGWKNHVNSTWKNIDINRISTKLWITDELYVDPEDVNMNSLGSSIIPKIYQCDFNYLSLYDQVISLNELMLLCSSAPYLNLQRVTVKNDDAVVSFEKLVEQLSQLEKFAFTFTSPSNNTSKNTFKELWKIPHFSNYDHFYLFNIPEDFDIDSFYSFIKKNKNTRMNLRFSDETSEESKTRLEAIIDEIIATENHEYKVPCFYFPEIDREKFRKLFNIFGR